MANKKPLIVQIKKNRKCRPLRLIESHRDSQARYVAKLAKSDPIDYSHTPKEKVNPLYIARMWLGTRLQEKPSGYWLDGLPVNLIHIMQATNRLLKASGAEQIDCDPRWAV